MCFAGAEALQVIPPATLPSSAPACAGLVGKQPSRGCLLSLSSAWSQPSTWLLAAHLSFQEGLSAAAMLSAVA